jgi:hypothetical protein
MFLFIYHLTCFHIHRLPLLVYWLFLTASTVLVYDQYTGLHCERIASEEDQDSMWDECMIQSIVISARDIARVLHTIDVIQPRRELLRDIV